MPEGRWQVAAYHMLTAGPAEEPGLQWARLVRLKALVGLQSLKS